MASMQRPQQSGQQCTFTDSAGVFWTVEEKRRRDLESSGEELSLIFESASAFRSVRSYPANWFDLDETALEKLSWGK